MDNLKEFTTEEIIELIKDKKVFAKERKEYIEDKDKLIKLRQLMKD